MARSASSASRSRAKPYSRRKRLPLPPLIAHPAARLVEDACRRLGVRAFPVPRAIVSADYRGRQACTYCGFCGSYGCEVGAKSSTLATFLAAAECTGRLTLRPGCRVTRVEAQDGRASSVLYLDAQAPKGIGVRRANHGAMQARESNGVAASGETDAIGNLGHGADLRVLVLVLRDEQNAILIACVDRQGDGHAREHHGVLERDEQQVAQSQFTLHSCTRYRNCT